MEGGASLERCRLVVAACHCPVLFRAVVVPSHDARGCLGVRFVERNLQRAFRLLRGGSGTLARPRRASRIRRTEKSASEPGTIKRVLRGMIEKESRCPVQEGNDGRDRSRSQSVVPGFVTAFVVVFGPMQACLRLLTALDEGVRALLLRRFAVRGALR